jgi:hypothetical protein
VNARRRSAPLVHAVPRATARAFSAKSDIADNWAIIASLIAKLNGTDPQRWLAYVLSRLVNFWPNERLDELMPCAWRADQQQANLPA